MTEHANRLARQADLQIAELIGLLGACEDAALEHQCPGREKLGDGSIAAAVKHTADNYERIAQFAGSTGQMPAGHRRTAATRHRVPRFLRTRGHTRPDHGSDHNAQYTVASVDRNAVITQLTAARAELETIGRLTQAQLDAVPPKDAFRFCDGKRTVEEVLAGLIKHQNRQLDAIKASLS